MLRRIDRVIVRVPALEAAVRYYRDVLEAPTLKQDARLANFRLADGQSELVIHNDPDLPAEAIYYLVDNVRDLYKRTRRSSSSNSYRRPPRSRGAIGRRSKIHSER